MATVAQISPLIDLLVETVLREIKDEKVIESTTAPAGTGKSVSGATGIKRKISHEQDAQQLQQG